MSIIQRRRPERHTVFNAKDYGATGNGTTDDTAALQRVATAASAAPGGTLYLPVGSYYVTGTPFSFTGANCPNIIGDGMWASRIVVDNNLSSTTDIIAVVLTTDHVFGIRLADFSIVTVEAGFNSGTMYPGRYGISFDYRGSTKHLSNCSIERVFIRNIGSATTGISIATFADVGSGYGFSYSGIRECYFESSLFFNVGDNISIAHCLIPCFRSMAYPGIQWNNTAGAANFSIVRCDIASVNGHIICNGGTSPYIAGNELETPASVLACTEVNNAMLDLYGASDVVYQPVVIGNGISSLSDALYTTGKPTPLRIANTDNAQIAFNRFSTHDTGVKGITVTASAVDSYIGTNYYVEDSAKSYKSISDSGARTQLWKDIETYTPTVTSSVGTITTLGTVTGRHGQNGRNMYIELAITITTNGTASTILQATLPSGITARSYSFLMGRRRDTGGRALIATTSPGSNVLSIAYADDNLYPGANGMAINLSGTIEIA